MCFDLYFVLNQLPDAIYTILKTFNQIFTQLKRINEFLLVSELQCFGVMSQNFKIKSFRASAF